MAIQAEVNLQGQFDRRALVSPGPVRAPARNRSKRVQRRDSFPFGVLPVGPATDVDRERRHQRADAPGRAANSGPAVGSRPVSGVLEQFAADPAATLEPQGGVAEDVIESA